MRKYLFAGIFVLLLLFLLRGYATSPSLASLWTVHFPSTSGLEAGALVEEDGRRIGKVIAVKSHVTPDGENGTDVVITIDPRAKDRLRENSTFLLTTPTGATEPGLRLFVFDETSPILPPGSHVKGADSELAITIKKQIAELDSTVREVSRQLDQFRGALESVSKSEEKRKLEEGVEGLAVTVRRVQDDITRVISEELARWRQIFEKIFPSETKRTV
jgi:ABC-type transporter Mla subunit MlaD